MAGSITKYETAQGSWYRVRYRKPDKQQTDKRGFKTKRDAELFLASVTVSKTSGLYVDPSRGKTTVGELGPTWLSKKSGLKPSTLKPVHLSWRV
ncbi:Arm DNA-binding domain-containing protein [Microbacterium oleivorans]|uniref:Arm DNA-binding domain-containing protein n=1 Tax=Microbacterium oleivorans TaxID=273677 RepID=UPI002116BD7E|nr:Arm DNA-binding domain-containing protein [Microbacterium oleivorans]